MALWHNPKPIILVEDDYQYPLSVDTPATSEEQFLENLVHLEESRQKARAELSRQADVAATQSFAFLMAVAVIVLVTLIIGWQITSNYLSHRNHAATPAAQQQTQQQPNQVPGSNIKPQ